MRLRLLPDPAARRRRAVLAALCLAALVIGAGVGAGHGGDDGPPAAPAGETAPTPPPAAALPLREQVGQLVILRFDGIELPDYAADALRAGEAGGVILFADNVASEAQLRGLTRSVQRAARRSALVATDQEGGLVRNIPFAAPAKAQTTVATPAEAGRLARATGRGLRSLGVNVNLAPVADVASSASSALAGRAYPGGADEVADLVAAAVRGHVTGGTAPAAKHFPGLGAATESTDDAPVEIGRGAAKLRSVDLEPFRAAVAEDVPLVMASHALYPALDPGRIASQSPRILGDVLRDELGFQGAVITDSLEAQAVLSRSSTPVAAVRSAAAGADLLLTTSSGSYPPVFERLLREARRSEAFRARVEDAAGRVLALKERLGLRLPGALRDG